MTASSVPQKTSHRARTPPFEEIIPYGFIGDKDVLEIGVGLGSHAELLSSNAALAPITDCP